jgi:hypothetical protein
VFKQSSLNRERLSFFRDIQATTDMCSPDWGIISIITLWSVVFEEKT